MKPGTTTMNASDETRLALLEQSIKHTNDTLIRFERRFDKLDDEIKDTKKELKSEIRSNFFWTLGVIASILAVVARGFHWF